jgi:uncharacterized lipoprotein YmbA
MPRLLVALAALLAICGCFGTTPPSKFFLLSPAPEAAETRNVGGADGALGVMPTRVAAYLDRPQLVTFLAENAVNVDEFNRWAEPLSAGVTRVLAQNLASLLPGWRVLPQPWDPTMPLRLRLVVEVSALGWDTKGEARLDATWALLGPSGEPPAARGRVALRRPLRAKGVEAGVEALSALLEELAREVATAARRLPPPA